MVEKARIQSIAQMAEIKEQKAAGELQKAGLNVSQIEQSLQQLDSIRDDYTGKFKLSGSQGMSACKLATYHEFLQKINYAIRDQEEKLLTAKETYLSKKQLWEAARQHRSGLEKLVQRDYKLQLQKAEKREREELDDHNSRLFFMNHSPA